MITLEEFSAWMRENSILSDSSVYKYTRAVNTISNEMKEKGVITESLLVMSALQLDVFVPLILHDPDFVAKNKRGPPSSSRTGTPQGTSHPVSPDGS